VSLNSTWTWTNLWDPVKFMEKKECEVIWMLSLQQAYWPGITDLLCDIICGGGQETVVLLFNSSPSSNAYFFSKKRRTTFRTEPISVSSRSNVFMRLAHPRQMISSSDMTTIYLSQKNWEFWHEAHWLKHTLSQLDTEWHISVENNLQWK
jgi:hypothetical protein